MAGKIPPHPTRLDRPILFFRARRKPVHSRCHATLPDYPVSLPRLCSETFEQLFRVLATLSKACLSEQHLIKQNIGLEHVSSTKKVNDFIEDFNLCEFHEC